MNAFVMASDVDQQKAAPLGLFVLVLLGVACYFLFKSMSRHLRHVRDDFPAAGYAPDQGATDLEDDSSGLTRPAPVTLSRGRATEPRLIEPRAVEPRVIEPAPVQPMVIEPTVIEPGGHGLSDPETAATFTPDADS